MVLVAAIHLFTGSSTLMAQTPPPAAVIPPSHDALPHLRARTLEAIERAAASAQGILGVTVIDLTSGDTFGVGQDIAFPQASAIKIPVLMEVFKQAHEGRFNLTDRLPVTDSVKAGGSGIIDAFGDGTSELAIRDLCVLMIVLSDNTATNMLINLVGMENVTATMTSIGASNTMLRRVMMNVQASMRGEENISTPADAARIMALLHRHEFVNTEVSEGVLTILRLTKPGNIRYGLQGRVPMASKPGEIPGAVTEWAIIELDRRPYVLVVMAKFAPGTEGADLTKQISGIVFSYFQRLANSSPYGALMDASLWERR